MFAVFWESWGVGKGEWAPCIWPRKGYGWKRMPKNSVERVVFKKERSFISLWSGNELMLFSTQRSPVPLLSVSKSFPSSLSFRPEGAFPDLFPSLPSVSQPCLQQRGCAGAQHWTGCSFSLCFTKQTFTSSTSGSREYIQILQEAGIFKNWGRLICCSQVLLLEVGCPGCSSECKTLMVSTVTTGLNGTAGTGAETGLTCDVVRSSYCLANLLLLFCYYFGNKKTPL